LTFESDSKLSQIEAFVFLACSSLSSISIPASVATLNAHCFYQCSNLSTVTIECGSKLSRIETGAFFGCSKLSSICIQSSIDDFPADCFAGCSQLSITQIQPGSANDSEGFATGTVGRSNDEPDAQMRQIEEDQEIKCRCQLL
jgi:hypothetical protein